MCTGKLLRAIGCVAVWLAAAPMTHAQHSPPLRFSVPEGRVLNEFYREGNVAAHLVATSGRSPRLVFAFPAGNSGIAVWFDAPQGEVTWAPDVAMRAAHGDGGSGARHGVTVELGATGGSLRVRRTILSSVRVIRDYQDSQLTPPAGIDVRPRVSSREIVWQRKRLDGGAGYYLAIEVLRGALDARDAETVELVPGSDGTLRLRITALTGDPPLTPIAAAQLLRDGAAPDASLRQMLEFLSYEEKLLAGSWRFDTYFGRDTLMSVLLLADVSQPTLTEAGLAAVLERLNRAGEVAHEEDIGEFAILQRQRAGEGASAAPLFDYKMIDDDYMLPIVAARYLLDTSHTSAGFLARTTTAGDTYGARLVRNLQFVVNSTASFAAQPQWKNLIALKQGGEVGNWRDSNDGLGGGRYPFDVNAVFAPAALQAIAQLHENGLLQPFTNDAARAAFAKARDMARVWQSKAPPLFDVAFDAAAASAAVARYSRAVGIDPRQVSDALGSGPLAFRAIALDADGRPIPILHSDEGFALWLSELPAAEAVRIAERLTRPFPAGLLTDVGLTVANPTYASAEIAARFDRNRYHGTVIWSWQQAMLAAGLARQLRRSDLDASARKSLQTAQARLRAAIDAGSTVRGSELWSWSIDAGRYRIEPFGQRSTDDTESNAAQLWSTVHLARPRW